MKQQWIPGLPGKIEPDRLYAVMRQATAGYSVGIVIRGEDCNWRGPDILGHYPLPLIMNSAESNRLHHRGEYEWPAPPVPCKDSHHCERDDCGRGPNPACPEYEPAAALPGAQSEVTTVWRKDLPDEQRIWWWWNGDPDGDAIPVQIMYSGTDSSYFASQGQHGWNRAQDVKEMRGLWMHCDAPEIPVALRKEAGDGR